MEKSKNQAKYITRFCST